MTNRVAHSAEAEMGLVFMLSQLEDRIDPSDDPRIQSRTEAYAESNERRS